jgi:hypothetical protein
MELFLVLGLPIVVIVALLRLLKLKWPIACLIIPCFAALATFIVNFTFCELLKTKCEPHGLNAVGYFFHWLVVSGVASTLDFCVYKMFFQKAEPHRS